MASPAERRFVEICADKPSRAISPDFLLNELALINVFESAGAGGGFRNGIKESVFLSSYGESLGMSKSMMPFSRFILQ